VISLALVLAPALAHAGLPLVRYGRGGPWLRLLPSGDLVHDDEDLFAIIRRDGSVAFNDSVRVRVRDGEITIGRPPRNGLAVQRFLEATADLRFELGQRAQAERMKDALASLPYELSLLWRDTCLSRAERRRLLFARWDEAAEPEDPELGPAGARARAIIDAFVRGLRDHEGELFPAEELARWNAERGRGPTFDPYRPPPEPPAAEPPVSSDGDERPERPLDPPAEPVTTSATSAAPRAAELYFDRAQGRAYLHGRVGTRPAWMLLDTGASSHVIGADLARELGLMAGETTVRAVDFEHRALPLAPAAAVPAAAGDFSPVPGRWLIAPANFLPEAETTALLLPQALPAPGYALVLDFASARARELPWPTAAQQLAASKPRLLGDVVISADTKFVLAANVRGRAVRLAVDTGSPVTALFVARQSTADLPGTMSALRARPGSSVRVGEIAATVDLREVEPASGPGAAAFDGVLGMDVLGRCALALDGRRLLARCD
jgi:predicted aspartyl protease